MLSTNISIYGLDEIKDYLSNDRINKALAIGVGEAVLQIHNALTHAVFTKYNRPNDLNKALQRSSSIAETGRGFIRDGLVYKDTITGLSQFPYTKELGNLNEPKLRKGLVHTVSVVRGQAKKVHGKYGYGGFTQRVGKRVVMLERMQKATWIGKERAPITAIFAMNLVDMANVMFKTDTNVKNAIDNVENIIIDKFI